MEIDNKHIRVCIPSFKEEEIKPTLESLIACDREGLDVKVKILINESADVCEETTLANAKTERDIIEIQEQGSGLEIEYEYKVFPSKYAGVGLARKTIMDEESEALLDQNINGLIVALDADTLVEENYFQSISQYFENTKFQAASIFYEHPLDSMEIIEYEFHLRYYNSMQHHSLFPFAIHTVGSAMVCTADVYKKKGGMNKRKAGEDFYFMQKFIKDKVCGNICSTTIYPSSRKSDRVPFGTGRAILKYEDQSYEATTYNPKSFEILKEFNVYINDSYENGFKNYTGNQILQEFLESIDFEKNYNICYKNTSNKKTFLKRFYQYFDAFTLMKCLHFMRTDFPDIPILEAAKFYAKEYQYKDFESLKTVLLNLRKEERERFRLM